MDSGTFFFLFVNLALSFVVAYIAKNKGRSAYGFFLLSFFLSFIIGLIVVLIVSPGGRKGEILVDCRHCTEPINAAATTCKHCGKDVEPQPEAIELAKVAEADKKRGAKMIVGIILSVIGGILILNELFQGLSILGLLVGGVLLAFGIINIVKANKSAKAAATSKA